MHKLTDLNKMDLSDKVARVRFPSQNTASAPLDAEIAVYLANMPMHGVKLKELEHKEVLLHDLVILGLVETCDGRLYPTRLARDSRYVIENI